jgi:hypothetical protein
MSETLPAGVLAYCGDAGYLPVLAHPLEVAEKQGEKSKGLPVKQFIVAADDAASPRTQKAMTEAAGKN